MGVRVYTLFTSHKSKRCFPCGPVKYLWFVENSSIHVPRGWVKYPSYLSKSLGDGMLKGGKRGLGEKTNHEADVGDEMGVGSKLCLLLIKAKDFLVFPWEGKKNLFSFKILAITKSSLGEANWPNKLPLIKQPFTKRNRVIDPQRLAPKSLICSRMKCWQTCFHRLRYKKNPPRIFDTWVNKNHDHHTWERI